MSTTSPPQTRPDPVHGQLVASTDPAAEPAEGLDAPLLDIVRTTRAMRRLKPDPVPRELLEQLVQAAIWGPSGSNRQAYAYVVVTDPQQRARLGQAMQRTAEIYLTVAVERFSASLGRPPTEHDRRGLATFQAQIESFADIPAIIAACYDRHGGAPPPTSRELLRLLRRVGARRLLRLVQQRDTATLSAAASIYPGVQNLLLTARALGLGATINLLHVFDPEPFERILQLPEDLRLFALVPVGWPDGHFGPVWRRPLNDALHWDRW